MRITFSRRKRNKGFSGILIKNVDWKHKTVSMHINSGAHSTDLYNFRLGENNIISPEGSGLDFTILSHNNSIIISILKDGTTLMEKEINFQRKKIL